MVTVLHFSLLPHNERESYGICTHHGNQQGLGFTTALTLGRAGHKVYATMRDPSRSPELAQTAAQEKLPIKVSVMDVDSDTSVKSGIASIEKDAGQIDVLVNNAGVESHGSVEELPLSEFRSVMETNYFGLLRCIQALVPANASAQERMHHQHVARSPAISPVPHLAPYTASKFAVEALSEALAGEMKTFGVRVAIVEPGIIDTRHGETYWAAGKQIALRFSRYALPICLPPPSRTRHSRRW